MESATSGNHDVLTLSTTLLKLVNDDTVTVAELVAIGGVSDSAVSRYCGDEATPSYRTVENWARSHKLSLAVTVSLLRTLAYGRPIRVTVEAQALDKSLDMDGDGKVSALDALRVMQQAQQVALDQTTLALKSMADGGLDADEIRQLEEIGNAGVDAFQKSLAVLAKLSGAKQTELKIAGGAR